MYRKIETFQTTYENFKFTNDWKLSEDNRWVIMAQIIPWDEFESEYAQLFSSEIGAPAKTFRMALGALIIKEKLRISDRETVEQIKENPYLQYFLGFTSFTNEAQFDSSMLVHFRNRISKELINEINKKIVKNQLEIEDIEDNIEDKSKKSKEEEKLNIDEKKENKGKLVLDATCTPADIKYPTDLGLLNEARTQTEKIIDKLYQHVKEKLKAKPRTYRKLREKNI